MRCFYCFEINFDQDLESPLINSYYGPVIKEDEKQVVIENHAENSTIFHNSHFGKIGLGRAIYNSPSDVINAHELTPYYNRFPVDENETLEVYMMGFFFESTERTLVNKAAKLCKKACLSNYQSELKRKIEDLQSSFSWTKEVINRKVNKF